MPRATLLAFLHSSLNLRPPVVLGALASWRFIWLSSCKLQVEGFLWLPVRFQVLDFGSRLKPTALPVSAFRFSTSALIRSFLFQV